MESYKENFFSFGLRMLLGLQTHSSPCECIRYTYKKGLGCQGEASASESACSRPEEQSSMQLIR